MSIQELIEEQRAATHELRSLYVPEWKLTVYAKTRFTLEMMRPLRRFAENSDPEALAEAIVRYALDQDGQRLFTREHKRDLMKYFDSAVIGRVGGWIVNNDEDEEEDDEGNAPRPPIANSSSSSAIGGAGHRTRSNGS